MKKLINNHKIKVTVFTFLMAFSISCTDLEDQNYDSIIVSDFTPTAEDLAALAGSAYVNWRAVLLEWNGLYRANEVSGDQMLTPARPNGWVDGGVYRRIHEHKWTSDDDISVNTWSRTYSGITNCNRVIYQIESGQIPVKEEDKISLIAEMKLLRASYYWVLCDFFGNVPIVDRFNVPEGYLP
jgi:hypothetical protein